MPLPSARRLPLLTLASPLSGLRTSLWALRSQLSALGTSLFALGSIATATAAPAVNWIPAGLPPAPATGPALCVAAYLKPDQGKATLDSALAQFPDRAAWEAYGQHIRHRIQAGAGLTPWPQRTPLNPLVRAPRTYDGYTVENVAFESVPGYFVTGNLYRPLGATGPLPVVLTTHGHGPTIKTPDDFEKQGRFTPTVQARGGTFARMGALVLSIEMVGYGDSIAQVGADAHKKPFTQTLQIWNTIRALDYLLALPGADPKRVAVTGESGGGTQTFFLTALDPRVTLSAPVVMVSSYFFGGCPCESGQPVHRSADHFANNVTIAALAAPRPLLLVSNGDDWTKHTPEIEFPFVQKIYGYYGATKNTANVHLPTEKHDYGPSKRAAVYRFVAQHFGLTAPAISADGQPDESRVTIEPHGPLHVFNPEFPLPAHATRDIAAVERTLRDLQR